MRCVRCDKCGCISSGEMWSGDKKMEGWSEFSLNIIGKDRDDPIQKSRQFCPKCTEQVTYILGINPDEEEDGDYPDDP